MKGIADLMELINKVKQEQKENICGDKTHDEAGRELDGIINTTYMVLDSMLNERIYRKGA